MSLLNVSGIGKRDGDSYLLRNINFVQEPSQKIAIAGSTGSGKTTLLKIIAGLIQPTEGQVLFNGEKVKGPQEKLLPGHPLIAYQSQQFELRNNYRVEEVLHMANKLAATDRQLLYGVCKIDHLLKRWTDELSGGEKQRIAFAKTLVSLPGLLLLDEPFSNLDAIHRNILKEVIDDISHQLKISCILVSHDPVDSLSWADEIIALHQGTVIQRGSPQEIYQQPLNEHVASLFGRYTIVTPAIAALFSLSGDIRFLRPQNFEIGTGGPDGMRATVKESKFMGNFYEVELNLENNIVFVTANKHFPEGTSVFVSFRAGA